MTQHIDHAQTAAAIMAAHAQHRTLAPITDRAELSMADAYAIQAWVTDMRLSSGQHVVGWKLGYTSAVMREQMGIASANFGPLTDAMIVHDGADIGDRFTQPRVEPEVALRFATDVPVDADRAAVIAAVGSAHAALEIVDSVWTGYRFRIEDNTADGSSAAGVVIGAALDVDTIADVAVVLHVDGEEVGRGFGRDASGHPADGVVWLAQQLGATGRAVRAGDVVITGGLTKANALAPGSVIMATFDGVEAVRVRRGGAAHRLT